MACDFDWYQDRWPWMTLPCYKFSNFFRNFAKCRAFGSQLPLNDSYCQRRNCSPLNVFSSGVQFTLISRGVRPLGGVKQGWEENKLFSSKRRQYLENGSRYSKEWLIGSCICAFDWHQDRRPGWASTAVNSNFRRISKIWETTAAKRMKRQRQRCNPMNLLFSRPY